MLFIAVGANLQSFDSAGQAQAPIATCIAAIEHLSTGTGSTLHAVSGWYRSAPVPPSGQPAYINGVAGLLGDPDPVELLARLHAIEAAYGRTRTTANGARTLDLDIIDLNGMVRNQPDPVLPHPRAHLRAFVLYRYATSRRSGCIRLQNNRSIC